MSTEQRYAFYSDDAYNRAMLIVIPWMTDGALTSSWAMHVRSGCRVTPGGVALWRDDLRKGWHVVPEGVRYVAVKGIVPGQACSGVYMIPETALRDAAKWNAGDRAPMTPAGVNNADVWTVLDLANLRDHRTEKPRPQPIINGNLPGDPQVHVVLGDGFADASPRARARAIGKALGGKESTRFQVRSAAEMREGEPWTVWTTRSVVEQDVSTYSGRARSFPPSWFVKGGSERFVVDTHSPEWQAFDAKHREPSARYVWKRASELVRGEPWLTWASEAYAAKNEPSGVGRPDPWIPGRLPSDCMVTVDLHDDWHRGIKPDSLVLPEIAKPQARRHRWQKNEQRNCVECQCGAWAYTALTSFPDVACELAWKLYEERAKPQGPSDAEIVEAWDTALREHEGGKPGPYSIGTEWTMRGKLAAVFIGSKATAKRVTAADHQEARSRELKRKTTESADKDRRRVSCQGDWPGEGEFDA